MRSCWQSRPLWSTPLCTTIFMVSAMRRTTAFLKPPFLSLFCYVFLGCHLCLRPEIRCWVARDLTVVSVTVPPPPLRHPFVSVYFYVCLLPPCLSVFILSGYIPSSTLVLYTPGHGSAVSPGVMHIVTLQAPAKPALRKSGRRASAASWTSTCRARRPCTAVGCRPTRCAMKWAH